MKTDRNGWEQMSLDGFVTRFQSIKSVFIRSYPFSSVFPKDQAPEITSGAFSTELRPEGLWKKRCRCGDRVDHPSS